MPFNPLNKNDRFLYPDNVSPKVARKIQLDIWRGIHLLREQVGSRQAVRVKLFLLQGINKKPIATRFVYSIYGLTNMSGINICISPKHLGTRGFSWKITGNAIHEYSHYLRFQLGLLQGSDTVLEQAIEEGLAIYPEAVLAKPPLFLDLKTRNDKTVRLCWDTLAAVLNQPRSKHPVILKSQVYLTLYYRLGFGIVRRYMDDHPKMTMARLIKMPRSRLIKYARQVYGQQRVKTK